MSCRNNEQCTKSQVQRETRTSKKRNNSLKKNNIVITRVRQFSSIRTLKKMKEIQSAVHELKSAKKNPEPIHAHSLRTTQMPPNCHCD